MLQYQNVCLNVNQHIQHISDHLSAPVFHLQTKDNTCDIISTTDLNLLTTASVSKKTTRNRGTTEGQSTQAPSHMPTSIPTEGTVIADGHTYTWNVEHETDVTIL